MAVTDWKLPASGQSLNYEGSINWNTPSNITIKNDANYTIASSKSGGVSSYHLRASGFGFTVTDIPDGSTIDGIEIRIDLQPGSSASSDLVCLLVKGSSNTTADHKGVNKAAGTSHSPGRQMRSLGGSADKWGTTLTDSDIRSSNFGFTYRATLGQASSVPVYTVEARIHYTPPAGGGGDPAPPIITSCFL